MSKLRYRRIEPNLDAIFDAPKIKLYPKRYRKYPDGQHRKINYNPIDQVIELINLKDAEDTIKMLNQSMVKWALAESKYNGWGGTIGRPIREPEGWPIYSLANKDTDRI